MNKNECSNIIYLPRGEPTPQEIVAELDKYIVGQDKAKRAVAVALRNRYRRRYVQGPLKDDIKPKNILMIGPTGVGKTEIARRLAQIAGVPFLKIEATKFTEVGYVGRDVDSMIRDLVEVSIRLLKSKKLEILAPEARKRARERLLDVLLPSSKSYYHPLSGFPHLTNSGEMPMDNIEPSSESSARSKIAAKLDAGELDESIVEIDVVETITPVVEVFSSQGGLEEMGFNLQGFQAALGSLFPPRSKKRKVKVSEAREIFYNEELNRLIDQEDLHKEALKLAEESGIIFLDEIDKIAATYTAKSGPDVSREGVQRDLLPLVEGTTVITKYGMVKTDHILFIAAGAFNVSKPSDLIPELQGRFPIRVELDKLGVEDFKRILTEPQNALIKQYTALLKVDGVDLRFHPDAITKIAEYAYEANNTQENIGARRLHTLLELILEEISFKAPAEKQGVFEITPEYVDKIVKPIIKNTDLAKFIL